MNLQQYQLEARKTAIYPNVGNNTLYPALGICGEAGEICEKLKKIQRDEGGIIIEATRVLLLKEVGDVCWYLAAICNELRMQLPDMDLNIEDGMGSPPTIFHLGLWISSACTVIAGETAPWHRTVNVKTFNEAIGILIISMAGFCDSLGSSLSDVLVANLEKLQSRQVRGVLQGSGDTR